VIRPRLWWRRTTAWLHEHETLLWCVHSAWALAFGIAAMWLGARDYRWLRVTFAYVAFIWATSLILPFVMEHPRLRPGQRHAARLVVNYLNKNFYQQLLFFVLPVYAASVTWGAPNVLFVVLVAVSAFLSTFDIVYDRHLSMNRDLTAVFFAFNLFVCVNVALPVLWGIGHETAMRASGALALLGFVTLRFHPQDLARRGVRVALLVSAALLAFFIEWGRPLVPPAPLRLVSSQFGLGVGRSAPAITGPLTAMPEGFAGRVYGVTAIYAPLGLQERVRHRWMLGTSELYRSPYYVVSGGRTQGYRLWTSAKVPTTTSPTSLDVWVETEGGQLIGRARLPPAAGR
jgi:hypothetical protein